MNSSKLVLFFILILNLSNCGNQANCGNCEIIEKIILHPVIFSKLHTELKERNTLYLLENEYCNINKSLTSNLKILTLKKMEILNFKNILIIKKFSNINNEYNILLEYPIEGMFFEINIQNNVYKFKILER